MDLSCPGQGQYSLVLTFVENDCTNRKFALKYDRLGPTRSVEHFNVSKNSQNSFKLIVNYRGFKLP